MPNAQFPRGFKELKNLLKPMYPLFITAYSITRSSKLRGLVDDIITYWTVPTNYFYIPLLNKDTVDIVN